MAANTAPKDEIIVRREYVQSEKATDVLFDMKNSSYHDIVMVG
jgi:hypothetical protein